jgi:hypothetical protein
MEYFGRNLFVMNILQAIINRKPLKTKELLPGKGGGTPGKDEIANKIANKEEREPELPRRIIVLKCIIHPNHRRNSRKAPLTRNQMVKLS